MYGTVRSVIAGMVKGVSVGYSKDLEIQGVGFKANLKGKQLDLALGYSHPIEFVLPEGVSARIEKLAVTGTAACARAAGAAICDFQVKNDVALCLFAERPGLTRARLEKVAGEMQHSDPDAVINFGAALLETLRDQGAIWGTAN